MEKKYKINMSDTIQQMKKIYFIVGLWKTKNRIAIISQFLWIFLIWAITTSVLVQCIITDQREDSVFLGVTALIGTLQVYRIYYVITKQQKILDVLHQSSFSSTDDYEIFCSADKKLKQLMTFCVNWIYISLLLFAAVAIAPLVKGRPLFDIAFPFDYKTSIVAFWLAYALVAGGFLFSVTLILFVVIMIWYMMLNFVVKYDVLGDQLANLGREVGSKTKSPATHQTNQNLYLRNLIESIESIENMNELLETFVSTFSNLFLFQVFTSSLCICGSVGSLAFSSHTNLVRDGFYFVVLGFCTFDVFTLMYLGNEIQLSFNRLSYCLFQSNWMLQKPACQICVIITMERLKRTQLLIVGKLFPLNMQTFGLIGNRAYSLFNVLQNFAE